MMKTVGQTFADTEFGSRAPRIVRKRIRSPRDIETIGRQHDPGDLRADDTIYDALASAAAEHPSKPAILQIEPPDLLTPVREVTYRELVAAIEQSASLFHESAQGARSVVAVMLPMVPEGLIATWGAATAGVAVPLNPFLEFAAIARIMNDSACTAMVTTRETIRGKCGGDLNALRRAVPGLRSVFFVDDDPGGEHDFGAAMNRYAGRGFTFTRDLDPHRDAVYMPTGGTTGAPKLVRMSQFGQLTVTWNVGALMGPRPDGVVAHGMPNFHCGGSVSLALRAMLYGQTLVTLTADGFRNQTVVAQFWDIAQHYRVTSLLATPTTAQALLSRPGGSSERHVIEDFHIGGSTLPTQLVREFHARFGIWLRENWGMTEVHGTVTGHPNDGTEPRIGSAGIALPYCQVKAIEIDHHGRFLRECAPDERGVLVIGGPTVTRGYLDPELNRGFFVEGMPDGQLWANTGDLGSVDEDGYVWVSGRQKDLIIRGGHNIDPGEIEAALSRHPAVSLVAAVGRPDAAKGEMPVAFVELEDGADVTSGELLEFCGRYVQERAANPVEVIILDRLPTTPVGKLAKPALRAMATEREVRSRVEAIFSDRVGCRVEVDNTGRRPMVRVEVEGVDDDGDGRLRNLRQSLGTYEFDTEVRAVESTE